MSKHFKCPNIGYCSKADRGEVIELPSGAEPKCPECGKSLIPVDGGPRPPWKKIAIAVVVALIAIGVGVGAWRLISGGSIPGTAETILRLHGSNTIGSKLAPALVEAYLQENGYTKIHRVKGAQEDEIYVVAELNGAEKKVEIFSHGSKTAFADLLDGKCDIGMASRQIKAEERDSLMPKYGDLTSAAGEHVIAVDGIAVIVHGANPVQNLTMGQLAGIFSGDISDWAQVGGSHQSITVYARDEKSGTYDFFKDSVLKPAGRSLTSTAKRYENSQQLSDDVGKDPAGIGFIGLNYVGSNRVVGLSAPGVEPRKPTLLTVKTEDYLLSRRLYLYASTTPTKIVSDFIAFAESEAGQKVVKDIGLVNLDVNPPEQSNDRHDNDPRASSSRWLELTAGAMEIQTHFRFYSNRSDLDTRAQRDIGRIAALLSQPQYQGKSLIIIGFADSRGSDRHNLDVSESRAEAIRSALQQEGANIKAVVGLGATAFVATNDTAEGQEKNRRVEVWVK